MNSVLDGRFDQVRHVIAYLAAQSQNAEIDGDLPQTQALAALSSIERHVQDMERAHAVQRDVEDFHRALDIPIGDSPAIRRAELRAELIREEAKETVEAILAGDLAQAIDGLCDLLCVTYGAAAEFGVNLAPFWDEVHRTNMAKQGGPMREDGKRLKPPGWTPPDIAGMLAALSVPAEPGSPLAEEDA